MLVERVGLGWWSHGGDRVSVYWKECRSISVSILDWEVRDVIFYLLSKLELIWR